MGGGVIKNSLDWVALTVGCGAYKNIAA